MDHGGGSRRRRRRQITSLPPKDGLSNDYSPVWSPDSSRLAFVRATARPNKEPVAALYVVNGDGTGLQRVAQLGPIPESEYEGRDRPSWSPDGRQLAYGNGPLYVVNSDGTNIRKLAASSTCSPSWSPDGRSILDFVDDYPCAWGRGGNASEPGYRSIHGSTHGRNRHRQRLVRRRRLVAGWAADRLCGRLCGATGRRLVLLDLLDGRRREEETSTGRELVRRLGRTGCRRPGCALGPWTAKVTYVATRSSRRLLPATSPGNLVGISKDGRTIAIFTWLDGRIVLVTVNGQVLQRPRVPSGWKRRRQRLPG